MSNHRQGDKVDPPLSSIFTGAALAMLAAGTGVWVALGVTDARHLVGVALALVLTGTLAFRSLALSSQRSAVLHQQQRDRKRQEALEKRLEARRSLFTGIWEGEDGDTLSVRWDLDTACWMVQGYLADDWRVNVETRWSDQGDLADVIDKLERSGEMCPWQTESTDNVRSRLGLGPWTVPEPRHVTEYRSASAPVPPAPRRDDTGAFKRFVSAVEQERLGVVVPPPVAPLRRYPDKY